MSFLSPWQFLLWIILLEILSSPIIAYLATWIINLYFSRKEKHDLNMLKRIINVVEEAKKQWIDKKEEGKP
jgi:hypothetical protein